MMTEDVCEAVCQDDAGRLRGLMKVQEAEDEQAGGRKFRPEDWEGHHIWPRRSRRMTILQLAVREGSLSVVKMLVSVGLSLDYGEAGTALVTALEYEELESLRLLIQLGADVNKRLMSGYGPGGQFYWNYPVVVALRCSNSDLLELLLQHGADPLAQFPLPDTQTLSTEPLMVTSLTPALRRARHDCSHLIMLLRAIPSLDGCCTCWKPIPESTWFELDQIFHESAATRAEQTELDVSVAKMMLDLGLKRFVHDSSTSKEIISYIQSPQPLKKICRFSIRRNFRLYDMTSHIYSGNHGNTGSCTYHRKTSSRRSGGLQTVALSHHPPEVLPIATYNTSNHEQDASNGTKQSEQAVLPAPEILNKTNLLQKCPHKLKVNINHGKLSSEQNENCSISHKVTMVTLCFLQQSLKDIAQHSRPNFQTNHTEAESCDNLPLLKWEKVWNGIADGEDSHLVNDLMTSTCDVEQGEQRPDVLLNPGVSSRPTMLKSSKKHNLLPSKSLSLNNLDKISEESPIENGVEQNSTSPCDEVKLDIDLQEPAASGLESSTFSSMGNISSVASLSLNNLDSVNEKSLKQDTEDVTDCKSIKEDSATENGFVLAQNEVPVSCVTTDSCSITTESKSSSDSLSLNNLDQIITCSDTLLPENPVCISRLPVCDIDKVPEERAQSLPPDVSNDTVDMMVGGNMERSLSTPVESGICKKNSKLSGPNQGYTGMIRDLHLPKSIWERATTEGDRSPSFWQVLDTLPLPKALIDYLKFKEMSS